ncbi:Uridine kinase [bioreactor metagenome]|uniref:Uridine kinase n=1 Tax=bioreactor metagenome TaxID=1076179 RepID=A0A644WIY8_9ZZZZ
MAYQLEEINSSIREDKVGFMEECDCDFQKKVASVADHIMKNMTRSPIVLLSGPSGSGKTTTALKIEEELEKRGVNTHTISMDNYFINLNPKTAPRTEDGSIDFESPKILDTELLSVHFAALAKGEEIIVPKYEFTRQMRNDARGRPLRLGKNEIAIFEGIHALNDDIAGRNPLATTLYISARSDIYEGRELRFKGTWMRLTRRAVRDFNFRGTDIASTLDMWVNVRRGEKLYISPYKSKANIVFDSSLRYEVPVMKHYAKPMLEAVPSENQRRGELLSLISAFDYFEPIDPQLVPIGSIIREFIGGGNYKYK